MFPPKKVFEMHISSCDMLKQFTLYVKTYTVHQIFYKLLNYCISRKSIPYSVLCEYIQRQPDDEGELNRNVSMQKQFT